MAVALLAVAGSPGLAAALGRPLRQLAVPFARGSELLYPIPDQDGASIDERNEVIIVRWQGAVYAFALACPHQNTALRWVAEDGRFQCPKHKSRYRPDGTFIEGRATRGMDRFAIRREGNAVAVNPDVLHEATQDHDGWNRAYVALDAAPSR